MDTNRFDALTKTFARQGLRRLAPRTIDGAAIATLLGVRDGNAAAAEVSIAYRACKKRTRRCRRKSRCRGGKTGCRQLPTDRPPVL